jgi:hypothetical protein
MNQKHVLIAGILVAWSIGVSAQNIFLDRARAAYEATPESQRSQIEDSVRFGGQIKLTPPAMTTTAASGGGLMFMNGLYCKEWNTNVYLVRESWLNQYLDATKSREQNPMAADRKRALDTVNNYCLEKPGDSVEASFSYAYRQAEARRIKSNAEIVAKSAEIAAKAEEARRINVIGKEAERIASLSPKNNPLLSSEIDSYTCMEWSVVAENMKEYWLKQYSREKDLPFKASTDDQVFRLKKLCRAHPQLLTMKAVNYVYKIKADLDANTTNAVPDEASMASVSWKARHQANGFSMKIATINQVPVTNDTEVIKLPPGFYEIAYSCSSSRHKVSGKGVIDLYIEPNTAEYFFTAFSHEPKDIFLGHPIIPGTEYSLLPIDPSRIGQTCSAISRQCNGRTYVNLNRSTLWCETEKRGAFQDLFSKSRWIMD